jgi:hypothetical protein
MFYAKYQWKIIGDLFPTESYIELKDNSNIIIILCLFTNAFHVVARCVGMKIASME